MNVQRCLEILREVKDVAFATVDEKGLPQIRIIDVMLVENEKLYFCTARGKDFYSQIIKNSQVAITGMNQNFQMIRLDGKAEKLEEHRKWIDRIFEENPSMNTVYPNESRYVLEAFCIENGSVEFFDLGKEPIVREGFMLGSAKTKKKKKTGFLLQMHVFNVESAKIFVRKSVLQSMWLVFIEKKAFFLNLLWEHLEISLVPIVIAVLFGGIVGILISEFQKTAKRTLGIINFLYTIPSISMLGFLIPFSGVGNATAVIALTVYALLPMVRNTHTGIANVDLAILEAAKGMGSTRMQILFKIKLPLAMPVVLSGIRNMVTMTIALAGIASFIGAGGLGVAIYRGITTNNAAMTMVGSLLIALLALIMDFLLVFFEKRISRRSIKAKKTNRIIAIVVCLLCLCMAIGTLFPVNRQDTIHIATKPMTEQYVLGEMLDILIEQDTDLNVELTQGVGGGTSNIKPAMESGEFDIYPEYTGTAWNMVLKKDSLYSEQNMISLSGKMDMMLFVTLMVSHSKRPWTWILD